jgi:hypothetical protein
MLWASYVMGKICGFYKYSGTLAACNFSKLQYIQYSPVFQKRSPITSQTGEGEENQRKKPGCLRV